MLLFFFLLFVFWYAVTASPPSNSRLDQISAETCLRMFVNAEDVKSDATLQRFKVTNAIIETDFLSSLSLT